MTKRLIFQLLLVLILLSSFPLKEYSQIKFRIVDRQLAVVSVTINGHGKFDFLLDTGTSHTIVTPGLARQLNIQPTFQKNLITQADSRVINGGYLDSISLGPTTAEKLDVLITDLRVVTAIDKNIVGVLGGNYLTQFDYLIDFDRRELTFERNGEIAGRLCGSRLPIENDDKNRLFITLPTKPRAIRFLLDSGATSLTLFGESYRAFLFNRNSVIPGTSSTVNGSYPAKLVRLSSLRIGDQVFNDLPAVLAVRDATQSEDGLMPLGIFRSVYLNQSKGYVVFNPE